MDSNEDEGRVIEAVVGMVLAKGYKSPFAVTYQSKDSESVIPKDQSITFSLNKRCWKGKEPPRKGQIVILEKVCKFSQGWRAGIARPCVL